MTGYSVGIVNENTNEVICRSPIVDNTTEFHQMVTEISKELSVNPEFWKGKNYQVIMGVEHSDMITLNLDETVEENVELLELGVSSKFKNMFYVAKKETLFVEFVPKSQESYALGAIYRYDNITQEVVDQLIETYKNGESVGSKFYHIVEKTNKGTKVRAAVG